MGYYNDYPNRKDWRKSFKKRSPAGSCWNHGTCDYCYHDRVHSTQLRSEKANASLAEMNNEPVIRNRKRNIGKRRYFKK